MSQLLAQAVRQVFGGSSEGARKWGFDEIDDAA
jgi:hypothetical protein